MIVKLHTDANVVVDGELAERIEAGVEAQLARFDRLTRVELHLSDESGGKRYGDDVRCLIEARAAGLRPLAVNHAALSAAEALDGAVEKLITKLTHTLERLEDDGARETIRGR